jgi:N-acetylmuramoyl-L-alanine amidase
VDTVVLHATVLDTLDEVVAHFSNPISEVSAHYTIDRDGTVVQHVLEEKRAWHAGQSQMSDGRINVNDFSIGIELVNRNDGVDPYPEPQMESLRELLRSIFGRQPVRHVVAHHECAQPPGRKSDPAGFDVARVRGLFPFLGV